MATVWAEKVQVQVREVEMGNWYDHLDNTTTPVLLDP
jgi:hypothetical protein